MEITTVFQKVRSEFGRSTHHFASTTSAILEELPKLEAGTVDEHIERSPTILDIQAIPDMSEVYVNTETVKYKATGMLHLEGGWPKDVDYTEKDQTTCAAAAHLPERRRGPRPARAPGGDRAQTAAGARRVSSPRPRHSPRLAAPHAVCAPR